MPQKMKATMTVSSKTQNYHIREIIYNIYEDNIFQNKKEIKLVSINAPSFIKDTAKFGHWMELIDDSVNPNYIAILNSQLDKAELKCFFMTLMSSSS